MKKFLTVLFCTFVFLFNDIGVADSNTIDKAKLDEKVSIKYEVEAENEEQETTVEELLLLILLQQLNMLKKLTQLMKLILKTMKLIVLIMVLMVDYMYHGMMLHYMIIMFIQNLVILYNN